MVFAVVRLIGLLVTVYAVTLLAIRLLMDLPEEPMLRYAVLALPMLAAGVVAVLLHGMGTLRRVPSGERRSTRRGVDGPATAGPDGTTPVE